MNSLLFIPLGVSDRAAFFFLFGILDIILVCIFCSFSALTFDLKAFYIYKFAWCIYFYPFCKLERKCGALAVVARTESEQER